MYAGLTLELGIYLIYDIMSTKVLILKVPCGTLYVLKYCTEIML